MIVCLCPKKCLLRESSRFYLSQHVAPIAQELFPTEADDPMDKMKASTGVTWEARSAVKIQLFWFSRKHYRHDVNDVTYMSKNAFV